MNRLKTTHKLNILYTKAVYGMTTDLCKSIQGAMVFERNSHALKRNYNFLWDMRYSQKKELWKKPSNHHKGA